MCGEAGGLNFHAMSCCNNDVSTLLLSMSYKFTSNSLFFLIKLVPLSQTIVAGLPFLLINLLSALIKDDVSME